MSGQQETRKSNKSGEETNMMNKFPKIALNRAVGLGRIVIRFREKEMK